MCYYWHVYGILPKHEWPTECFECQIHATFTKTRPPSPSNLNYQTGSYVVKVKVMNFESSMEQKYASGEIRPYFLQKLCSQCQDETITFITFLPPIVSSEKKVFQFETLFNWL